MDDTCATCGERNPAGSQFCLFCGAYLGWDEARTAAREEPGPTAPTPPTATGRPTNPTDLFAAQDSSRETVTAPGVRCGSCSEDNPVDLHFCRRCATPLHEVTRTAPLPHVRTRWWHRFLDPTERAARLRYRRSLPPLYRWRRVVVATLIALVAATGLVVTKRNPVAYATTTWHELRKDLVAVPDVTAHVVPPDASQDPGAAVAIDGRPETALTLPWRSPGKDARCTVATGAAALRLEFPTARVRGLDIIGGLTDAAGSPPELVPTTLHVSSPTGACFQVTLKSQGEVEKFEVDTFAPVSSLTIFVTAVIPPSGDDVPQQVSLAEVTLLKRPG